MLIDVIAFLFLLQWQAMAVKEDKKSSKRNEKR